MNNRILSVFLLFIFLGSCKKEIPLLISSETFTEESLDICKNIGCPEITVNYIEIIGKEDVSEKINSKIKEYIIASLYLDEGAPTSKTISEASEEFIKTYRLHSAEFPDMAAEYFAQINVSENFSKKELISIETKSYLYTGGAHGYGSTSFLNINPETGDELSSEELFKDMKAFTTFAEKKFKQANEIPQGDPINSTGFWFEDDVFTLPESIGFFENSVLLIYNQYDIASYAAGAIELSIPLEEVKEYLNFNLR